VFKITCQKVTGTFGQVQNIGVRMMKEEVYEFLDKLNIEYEKVDHPAFFCEDDHEKYDIKIEATICKNLFLRNKNKSKYYLVSLPLHKKANLKLIQEKLNETRLSFGNEEILEEKLNIKTGSVSIFNIVSVKETDVKFIIDEEILEYEKIAFHPNINTASVIFNANDISKILDNFDVNYEFVNISD